MQMPKLPSFTRGQIFRALSIATIAFVVLVAVIGAYVYKKSVGRFEVRRLSLPTRIYADLTVLRPEAALSQDDLLETLDRLGYREVKRIAAAGEWMHSDGGLDVFTRGFSHPSGQYPSEALRITFGAGKIATVVSLRESRPVETAALEPELLTSVLGDQLENRRPITLDQVPKHLQEAVVATEDVRFWHHPGVDPLGITRALFRNVKKGGVAEGGSTLTQQLVKNYYLTSERTMRRKVVEAFMALVLDAKYSKREILEAYLNDIYLGRNRSISIVGVGEAARFYFGKPVSEITVGQAALIAGMVRSPNNYSPFSNPAKALQRRNTVLGLMLKQKKIDQATYDTAKAEELPKKPFRDRSGLGSIPFYVDRVLQEMSRDYGITDVRGRGLQIYTAIDLAAQDASAKTIESGLLNLEKGSKRLRRSENPLEGVVIVVDVPTGEIRALVGGRNYERSQFNRALLAKRSVGSLFKPFVFLTAFEPSLSSQNITPATLVSDTRFVLKRRFSPDWSPRNYDEGYHGTVTVREALEQSMNSASVRIGLACGIEPIIKTARTLGVATELEDNPSIILGAVGIPPIEMADAYSTIARQGSRLPLRTIRFVTSDRGKMLTSEKAEPVQVFPARDAYILTNVMRGVVDRGTAGSARSLGFRNIAAGKTGTTNEKRDAWFIGFTPKTLALTWVGFDDNAPTGLSGSDSAVPIWARLMNVVTEGEPNIDFVAPSGIVFAEVDEKSGGLAVPACPKRSVVNEAFKAGTQPSHLCPLHAPQAPQLPLVDQFGNPIVLDTGILPPVNPNMTDTAFVPPPVAPPVAPDSTLTGGVFRPEPPPPATPDPPPPTATREPEPDSSLPTPSTNTSAPPG